MASNMTEEQISAFELAKNGHRLYIGGQAGTGKTFLITKIYEELVKCGKTVSITCSTGIACSALPTHAKTIHSWAGIDDGR